MLDLAVTGGHVVIPEEGILQVDLGIADGRLVHIAAPGTLPQATETLDVAGRHVLPGVIDPHAQFGVHTAFERDVEHETRAALAGGITTIGCFLRERPSYHAVFERFTASM